MARSDVCVSMNATLTSDQLIFDMADDLTITPTETLNVSFEDFYRTEYPALVAVATALVGSVHSAEDLVQDTMVKSLIRWRSVQRLAKPGGWAHRVLLNACTSWWRRRRTEANYLARMRRAEPSVAGPSPESMMFWAAVRRLPERHRKVMVLHYAGDHSVEEVASILSVPEGTVRSDLTRARAALANQLGA
ncbi:MAG TPA: SigE family RNA polymerase sigma factor [Ilumatobacteraceae bacterium]|nr:SigE family RNA polymerase sigma factor [Ilumatobacteraceae bacterium]